MRKASNQPTNAAQPAKKTYQDYNNQKPVRNDPHFTDTEAGAEIPDDDQVPRKKSVKTKNIPRGTKNNPKR